MARPPTPPEDGHSHSSNNNSPLFSHPASLSPSSSESDLHIPNNQKHSNGFSSNNPPELHKSDGFEYEHHVCYYFYYCYLLLLV